MSPIVLSVMLVVANVMGAGMIVPQVVRLRRSHNTRGISASWIGVGLAMNLWWVGYGLAGGLWGIIPVSAMAFVLYLVIVAQYAGINGVASLRNCVVGMVGLGIVPLPALILDGWATAGLVVGLCYAVQFAPAALTALRSDVLEGVSPITWAMAGTEAAIWLIYGLNQADSALMIGGGGGLAMSLVILVRLARLSPRRQSAVAADSEAEHLTLAR